MFGLLRRKRTLTWVVDHDKAPVIPKGARSVLRHKPVQRGVTQMQRGNIDLVEFRRGTTYEQFYRANEREPLCDVTFLDSLIQLFMDNESVIDSIAETMFPDFSGQIFFLGTEFESFDGSACVPYLNIKTYQPALRYLCPSAHVINHDVNCCAAFFREVPAKSD